MDTGAPLPMPGTTRAAITVHWLQALLFAAATVSFALSLQSRISHGQPLLDGPTFFTWFGLVFCATFAALTTAAAIRLHRRGGRTFALVLQWILATLYGLAFVMALIVLIAQHDYIAPAITAILLALPVAALILLSRRETSRWFET
ncbi:hypothetical protein [Nonomuraea endophytica]|uniref:hypothetical protein n=1 Tax=Nonomuraea endophytica TaxID=714136 RepID=UPI0037C8A22C